MGGTEDPSGIPGLLATAAIVYGGMCMDDIEINGSIESRGVFGTCLNGVWCNQRNQF